ncbi:hypothetical protein M413DRAFT_346826 [Hebeloma cylindrosporum]|uniref:Secreted peptide n=1 Tax=Hebeloma cylindrosporum TaxID=76867 RepID=A0A0C3BW49_HEBCY|nr:hypothetical protein M413DRAFT_346826 [Hebeloma cylindrosporum h7]
MVSRMGALPLFVLLIPILALPSITIIPSSSVSIIVLLLLSCRSESSPIILQLHVAYHILPIDGPSSISLFILGGDGGRDLRVCKNGGRNEVILLVVYVPP